MGKRKGEQTENNADFIQQNESEKKKRRKEEAQPFQFMQSNEANIHHINPETVTEEDIEEKKALRKIKQMKGFKDESSILGDVSLDKGEGPQASNVKVGGEDFSKSKEGSLFMEDGQVFEPFNLNEERETGKFDESMNFIWNKEKQAQQQQKRDKKKKKMFDDDEDDENEDENEKEKDAFVDQVLEDAEKLLLKQQKQSQKPKFASKSQESNENEKNSDKTLKDVFIPFEGSFISKQFFIIFAPFFNIKENEIMEVFFLKASILNWLDWWQGMKSTQLKDISTFFNSFVGFPPTADLLNSTLNDYPDFSSTNSHDNTITEVMKHMKMAEKFTTSCISKLGKQNKPESLSEALLKAEKLIKSFSLLFSNLCIECTTHFGEFGLYTTTWEELEQQVSKIRIENLKLKSEFISWSFTWNYDPKGQVDGPYDTKVIREWMSLGYFKHDNAKIKLVIKDENVKKKSGFLQSLAKLGEFQDIGDVVFSVFP